MKQLLQSSQQNEQMTHNGNRNNDKTMKYKSLYANISSEIMIDKGWTTITQIDDRYLPPNLIIHHGTGSDVRTIHESMTRSRSSLLAMTWPFRSQAQIQLPAPGLDNDQTALPPGRPVSSNAHPRGLKMVSNARPMPAPPPLPGFALIRALENLYFCRST